uniref:Uncharacterized protein n=1 Tax=Timema genevievae TaxID=629358 RepID=A0A7R9JY96_TIMGE|nr:unnamed protein product [Timema genevievae]
MNNTELPLVCVLIKQGLWAVEHRSATRHCGYSHHYSRHTNTPLFVQDASLKALKFAGGRLEAALDYLSKQQMEPANGITKGSSAGLATMGSKLIRKPSLERGSPALDSGAGSSRSDSPRLAPDHPQLSRQYSPSSFTEPPPPPPPRCSSTPPPPPPPHPASVQHLLKRMSPAPSRPAPTTQSSQTPSTQRGNSPVGSRQQPMVVQNGPQAQQQLTQQMQALNLYPSGGSTEPPPPYPSYTASIQSRQSPTQDYRKSPSSGIYSGSPSPVSSPAPPSVARPTPLQAWGARQAKTQPPIIMQSVKSTQVQKPVLQTAIAPTAPPVPGSAGANSSPPPPSYATSIQQKQQQHHKGGGTVPTPASSPVTVPTTDPPSYASTMQALAAQRGQVLPPPPYGPEPGAQVATVESSVSPRPSASVQRKFSPATSRSESPETPPLPPTTSSSVAVQNGASERRTSAYKVNHQSPIPERKRMSKEKEEERRDCKVRNYSPQAFKFFMEQHIENVIKSYKQRVINWETTLHIPKSANMSAEGMDLILKLCIGADRRLGKNAGEIKTHQFFSRVDFDLGLRRQVAPHIPRIQFSTDTSNFDPVDPERLRDSGGSSGSDEPTDGGKLFHGFFEFTFRRFFDDGGGGPAYPGKISLDDTDNQGGPVYGPAVKTDPNRPLPLVRGNMEEQEFGFHEPKMVPRGRCSLRQALQFINDHETDPVKWSCGNIASEYHIIPGYARYEPINTNIVILTRIC